MKYKVYRELPITLQEARSGAVLQDFEEDMTRQLVQDCEDHALTAVGPVTHRVADAEGFNPRVWIKLVFISSVEAVDKNEDHG